MGSDALLVPIPRLRRPFARRDSIVYRKRVLRHLNFALQVGDVPFEGFRLLFLRYERFAVTYFVLQLGGERVDGVQQKRVLLLLLLLPVT